MLTLGDLMKKNWLRVEEETMVVYSILLFDLIFKLEIKVKLNKYTQCSSYLSIGVFAQCPSRNLISTIKFKMRSTNRSPKLRVITALLPPRSTYFSL